MYVSKSGLKLVFNGGGSLDLLQYTKPCAYSNRNTVPFSGNCVLTVTDTVYTTNSVFVC